MVESSSAAVSQQAQLPQSDFIDQVKNYLSETLLQMQENDIIPPIYKATPHLNQLRG